MGALDSFTVTTLGYPYPSLTETGALPSGVTFVDNGDGTATLMGTPAPGTIGVYNLVFTASNGVGSDATQNFTLTVNQAPAITSASSTSFQVLTAGSFTVTATGSPTPSLTETGTLPSGVSFVDNSDGTATLSGTPAAGTTGTYTLIFTAYNGGGSDAIQTFTLTVSQAPAITSAGSTSFTVGKSGSFTVTTSGYPDPALTASGALPSGVTFIDNGNGTATLGGTPAAGTGGTYDLAITAQNGVGSAATQNFILTVNQAPAITSAGSTSFMVGTAGSFTVVSTGYPDPTLTETGALPSGVTFVDNPNGTATLGGTPLPGSAGVYTLTITAQNGVGTDATQQFTLTVNQAPAITSAASTSLTIGTAGSFTVVSTGYPDPTLTETGALPSGVTFVDNGNGTARLGGTPSTGSSGIYHLNITAHNGVGNDALQSFTLTVNQVSAITTASGTTFMVLTLGSFNIAATGYPSPALSETGALPSGVTFVSNGNGTATLSGTPAAGTAGSYSLSITAHNGVGNDAVQNFTLTVAQPPAITSAASTSFVVGTAGSLLVTTTGFPEPSLVETGALPGGVTFVDNGNGTAALSGTPAAGTAGTYDLTITAHNGIGSDATQTLILTVNQRPAITSSSGTIFTVTLPGRFTIASTGSPTPSLTETGTLPSGVTFIDNGNGTATLSGTPGPYVDGIYDLTITAHNGVGTDATQNFVLTVNPAADLVASLSAAPQPVEIETNLTYTATVRNTGPSKATNVTLVDALPSDVTFVSAAGGVTPAGNVLTFNIGTLAVGATATVQFVVSPTADLAGLSLTNQVQAQTSVTLINPSDSQASAMTAVLDHVGTIEFSAASYSVPENAGVAAITVNRVDGKRGAITVNYTTVSIGATAGLDYTPVSGTLTFPNGVTSLTITVPVLADPYDHQNEPLDVVLSNIHSDQTIGKPILATPGTLLTIVDIDPNYNPLVVTGVQWTGTLDSISQIFLTFSKPLIASTALNSADYALVDVGPDGRYGTLDDSGVAMSVSFYQSSDEIVTLTPAQPLPANQFFHLWISGSTPGGVEDVGRNMLAGDGSTPGSAFTVMMAQGANLKYYTPSGDQVSLKITGGGVIDDLLTGTGQGLKLTVLDEVPHHTTLTGTLHKVRGGTGVAYLGYTIWGLGNFGDVRVKMYSPPFQIGEYPFSPGSTVSTASTALKPLLKVASPHAAGTLSPKQTAEHTAGSASKIVAISMNRPFHKVTR